MSPNYEKACAEYDAGVLYLNDGSVVLTELKGRELYPAEWKDGVAYPRGYYRFH